MNIKNVNDIIALTNYIKMLIKEIQEFIKIINKQHKHKQQHKQQHKDKHKQQHKDDLLRIHKEHHIIIHNLINHHIIIIIK